MTMAQDMNAGDRIGKRWPEAIVATTLLVIALLVIKDALRTGNGWGDDGPQAGYFPFRVGLLLAAASAWVLVQTLRGWAANTGLFAERGQLKLVVAMLVPMVVYVAGIAYLGIYLASLLLIAYFMKRHGKYRSGPTLAVATGVPLTFYLVFERWFLVPLPKGPIERLLGL